MSGEKCPACGKEGVKPDKDLTAFYGEVKWHCVNPDCRVMTFEPKEEASSE